MKKLLPLLALALLAATVSIFRANADNHGEKIKVLLVDGQNNHNWVETSPVLKQILEDSGKFSVDVSTSPPSPPRAPRPPKDGSNETAVEKYKQAKAEHDALVAEIKAQSEPKWAAWRPDFFAYDVVVSNYNGEEWPKEVQEAFDKYVADGGGFVSVHAANNAFPQWEAYNAMIGVGGWGGRSELSGPYLRLRDGEFVHDMTPGRGGSHGPRHEFVIEKRADHPIVNGLPDKWLHAEDELYDRLRGPAENLTVLASAFSSEDQRGSGEHEPLLMVIDYGEGRIFHTALGHDVVAIGDVGFAETLQRGTEWAATGEVTFPEVSADVLTLDEVALRQ